jgi:cytochrome c553
MTLVNANLSAQDSEQGKVLYKKCITCHGKKGYGKKSQKAPMIAGQYDWYLVDHITQIRDKKRNNSNAKKMYPFVKNLSDEEIAHLAAYISTMPKK